jgi:pimeloyl-ACP methyl ester carboxylesterase
LLLVHSINAAASAAEMRPLHLHHQTSRTVVSVDLPGYGLSDRSDRPYTPRLMTDAVLDAAAWASAQCGGQAVDALALSLSCEFLARAATESPQRYRSLALVSPTGLAERDERRGPPQSTLGAPWIHGLLRGPGWGRLLFKGLTRPGVVRFFLQKTWGSPHIDDELWRQAVLQAQAEGAEHAPLYFLSGQLFSRDIQDVYERLKAPVWLSHGVRGDFTDYRKKSLFEDRANWRMTVYETGAMPYFEAETFNRDYSVFLEGAS